MKEFVLSLIFLFVSVVFADDISKSVAFLHANKNFVQIKSAPGYKIDLRYATKNNFVGENMYGTFKECWLEQTAADKLKIAFKKMREEKPKWSFIFYDCLRPRAVQRILWAKVVGTPNQMYVGNPDKGSVHNFGLAIDIGLLDENGKEVDMGTGFDSFSQVSQPKLEDQFLKVGKLTPEQLGKSKGVKKRYGRSWFHPTPPRMVALRFCRNERSQKFQDRRIKVPGTFFVSSESIRA